MSDEARIPQEQIPITLFAGVVIAVRARDGQIYVSLRDLCDTLDLILSSQTRAIRADDQLRLVPFRLRSGNQVRTMDCLHLDDLALWLLKVRVPRTKPETSTRLQYIKTYLTTSVRSAFAALTGIPDVASGQIEDLRELDTIGPSLDALQALADRQLAIEQSQDLARDAWRDLAIQIRDLRGALPLLSDLNERLQTIERQLAIRLSPEQRNTIYRLVQAYGEARAERTRGSSTGAEIRRAWAEFNARFKIATYTDLPAEAFATAVQWVQTQYRTVTGHEIDAGTQERLL